MNYSIEHVLNDVHPQIDDKGDVERQSDLLSFFARTSATNEELLSRRVRFRGDSKVKSSYEINKKEVMAFKERYKIEDLPLNCGIKGNSDSTADETNSTYTSTDHAPDFFEGSYGYTTDDDSLSVSNMLPEERTEESQEPLECKTWPPVTSLKQSPQEVIVDFNSRHRRESRGRLQETTNDHCRSKSPVVKAIQNIRKKVLAPKQETSPMEEFRSWSREWTPSTHLSESNPPTYAEYRDLEKGLMESKLELAVVQTELDNFKAVLRKTIAEREWLHCQHSLLQHQYQDSQDTIAEYQTIVKDLKEQLSVASMSRKCPHEKARESANTPFPTGHSSARRRSRSPATKTQAVFNPYESLH